MQEPPLLDFVPEPIYSKFMPPEDDVLPAAEQANACSFPHNLYYWEEESSKDDTDDDDEEEHQALADSVPPPAYRTTARMSIRAQIPIPFPSEAEIPSPPLPVSSPLPMSPPLLPTRLLGYKSAMIRLRAESPSTSHLLSLPPPIVLPVTRASMAIMRAAAPSTYILAP
ncbi:hypothetical protein Tco_0349445 [Tanacetum coccineum]